MKKLILFHPKLELEESLCTRIDSIIKASSGNITISDVIVEALEVYFISIDSSIKGEKQWLEEKKELDRIVNNEPDNKSEYKEIGYRQPGCPVHGLVEAVIKNTISTTQWGPIKGLGRLYCPICDRSLEPILASELKNKDKL